MVVVATAATGSAAAGDGEEGGDGYGARVKERTEGKGSVAHGGSAGADGGAGEALVAANRRRGRRRPKVEEDDGEGVRGLPASGGLARRKRGTRRSSWTFCGGVGRAVVTVELAGGDGFVRSPRERETEGGGESSE